MGWSTLALWALAIIVLVTAYRVPEVKELPPIQRHIPPSNVPSFQRSSVEKLPYYSQNLQANGVEYGSQRLPLRSAVEALPDIPGLKSQELRQSIQRIPEFAGKRIPLRDAVEHRNAPFFGGFTHESIWLEQTTPPSIRGNKNSAYVVCHFESNGVHRVEPFSLTPQAIPSRKCTHLVYRGATIDPDHLTVISKDPEYDEVKGGYKLALEQRKEDPSLRVLLSINLPEDKNLLDDITNSWISREKLSQSILDFQKKHEFDGIEIDWNYNSMNGFKDLMRVIYESLSSRGLTVLIGLGSNVYPDPKLTEVADLLILQAWRTSETEIAVHPAPLNFAISVTNKWLNAGTDARKIILGAPLVGASYTLKLKNSTDLGAPVLGPGFEGTYTKKRGTLAYYEICEKLENFWSYGRDEEGPYIKRGDQWIGYDDPVSTKLKAAYIKSAGLAGISLMSLDLDDFVGICGEPWPILNTAVATLGNYEDPIERCDIDGFYPDLDNCAGYLSCKKGLLYRGLCSDGRFFDKLSKRCLPADPEICISGTRRSNILRQQKLENLRYEHKGPRVVCYITSWSMYRKGDGKFAPEQLKTDLCTDVVYSFAGLDPESLEIQPFDPWADIDNNLFERVTSLSGPRSLLGLGGWTDSSGDKYSRLVNSPGARKKFVKSTINFLQKYGFEGLSFEWLYPVCWQSQCSKGPKNDRPNFTKLLQELKNEFAAARPKLTLAVAVSGYKEIIDVAYDFPEISEAADFISIMTYDYHGAWEKQVGHLSPLYGSQGEKHPFYNTNFTMNYIASLGATRSKLLVGVPFYGQTYRLVQNDLYKLGDPVAGAGASGEFTKQPGMLAYYEICDRIKRQNWKVDKGPTAHYKDQLVAYEDVTSIEKRGRWIVKNGFGGATAWTADLDDFTNRCCMGAFPLLTSLNYGLGIQNKGVSPFENCERPPEPITPPAATLTTPNDALEGGNGSYQTSSMTSPTTTKATTWPTWTEKPSKRPMTTASTSWTWTNPTTTTTVRTTTINWTPAMMEIPCNGVQYVANPKDCGSYFKCDRGVLKREQCPAGLHWDDSRGRCNWPSMANCQQGTSGNVVTTPVPTIAAQRPTITTTSPKPPASTIAQSPTTMVQTKECEHGQYYAYPNSCTNFLICVNGNLVTQQCGPGLNWDDKKHMCDWAFKNPCKTLPTVNSAALVMKEIKLNDHCVPGSFSSVPGDCGSYYTCLWGRREKFECAPGLHFSKESHICDWPSRANCDDHNEQTTRPSVEMEIPITQAQITSQRPWKPALTTESHVTTQKPWMENPSTQKPWNEKPSTQRPITTQNPWTEKPKPLPPPQIDPTKVSPLSGHYKVVCYFTNWAWYRKGIGRYLPENIDHTLCTHIVYGFAVLDYSNLVIKAHDSWADYDNRFYERVLAYKQRGLKVILALGGWNDSAGDKYSRLVNSPAARTKFIKHALEFLEKYGFDGLDLDWEYPVCWQVDCNKGPKSDKQSFSLLLRELSEKFKPRGLLLSSAVSPSKTVIDEGYDVPALAKYLDWIAVMAYDYHGQWDKKTGHVAPLFYHPDDDVYFFNANYTINYWISKGAPPRSIVMGMPMYGQSFTLNDPQLGVGLNSKASAGNAGEFTKAAGFLAYYEICDRIKNRDWKVIQDPDKRMGPYAYKGSQWVSFDDVDMIRKKSQFIRDMGLGGGMIWALDLDDFKNRCGSGPHPLMHAIQQVLADPPNARDKPISPPDVGQELEWKVPMPRPITSVDHEIVIPDDNQDKYKMICYFTNWAWYRQNGGRFVPEDIDTDLCTHVVYGFAVLDGSTLTIKTHDSWADIDNKFYERVVAYKSKGIKVLLAIGGWNDSAGDKYSRLVNSPSSTSRFISHVVQFIEKYGFEGLDLDWEYPVCWQVDCTKGPASDKQSFSRFVKQLSETFKPKGLLLSTAVSPSKRVIDAGYDVPELSKYFDWISVMTYDFHGQWDKKTGHVAPLYHHPQDWEPTFNANFSIHYWIAQGAPPKKLVMGAPLYGQSFSLAERSQHGLNALTYGGGEAGEATRARGFLAYYEICEKTLKHGWTVVQDPERRMGPYAYKGDQWVSFDDAHQIKLKAQFIKEMGLGGGMVWALDLDDFKNRCGCEASPLLRTMNRVLRNYPDGPECEVTAMTSAPIGPETTTRKPSYVTIETENQITTTGPIYLPPTATETIDFIDTVEVTAGSSSSSASPPMKPSIGECNGKMFRPHKNDCSKYTICNFGELLEQTCPNGLHWNEDRCDWPENSKCKSAVDQGGESNAIPDLPERPENPSQTEFPIADQTTSSNVDHVDLVDLSEDDDGMKVVCYFTNWAWYRPGSGKYTPDNIDPNLCTHIVYGFTVLDGDELIIKLHDSWADIDNDFYGKVTAYRSKGIKVLIAIGGWNDSAGDKYSRLVNNAIARKKFIKHAIGFIEKYGFDGLDLDWEYPVCWQVECERGPSSDKEAFATFVRELSREFRPKKLLLSAAVSPSKRVIDHGYDVPTLGKYLNWIAVMTYDFHGNWERKTGHVAPLYYYPGDDYDYFNANFSMRYWMEKGAPASKLVMGLPFYGQSFTLSSTWNRGLQAASSGPGEAGPFTRSSGFLAFYEICDKVKNDGYAVMRDPEGRIGPYATRGNQWVGYDDVSNVVKKANFIRELGLAGGMVWALDLDDFNNNCGCGKYPLLSALNGELRGQQASTRDCT